MQLQVQLIQIQARQVAHLDLLQVLPQPFHRIQVRGRRRPRCPPDRGAGRRQERLHLSPPGDRRPVPDPPQPIPAQAAQGKEEPEAGPSRQRRRPYSPGDRARRRQASQDRPRVVGRPLVQDGRLARRTRGLDHRRPAGETRFVPENQGPALRWRPLLQRGPGRDPPAFERLVVAREDAGEGEGRRRSPAVEPAGQGARAGRVAERRGADINDAVPGPDVAPNAVRSGALPEEVRDQAERRRSPLGLVPRRRSRPG